MSGSTVGIVLGTIYVIQHFLDFRAEYGVNSLRREERGSCVLASRESGVWRLESASRTGSGRHTCV